MGKLGSGAKSVTCGPPICHVRSHHNLTIPKCSGGSHANIGLTDVISIPILKRGLTEPTGYALTYEKTLHHIDGYNIGRLSIHCQ